MIYITRTQKSIIAVAVILVTLISGTVFLRQEKAAEISLGEAVPLEESTAAAPQEAVKEPEEISVYICGYVNNPGVIEVTEGTRLDEGIKLVGGAKPEADLEVVNLAYKLADEDMIYIPKKGEKLEGTGVMVPGVNTIQNVSVGKPGKININTAGESELDSLQGIGPATAKAIIQYRNANGGFKSIEEIKKVKGIGDSKFNSIKDSITVD
jgi:competence protein ComEA